MNETVPHTYETAFDVIPLYKCFISSFFGINLIGS